MGRSKLFVSRSLDTREYLQIQATEHLFSQHKWWDHHLGFSGSLVFLRHLHSPWT